MDARQFGVKAPSSKSQLAYAIVETTALRLKLAVEILTASVFAVEGEVGSGIFALY